MLVSRGMPIVLIAFDSDKSSLGAYYDEIDAGSYAQSRRAYLPSYGDDDFGVIVHRRITQEFVVGRKMASFDPSERRIVRARVLRY